MVCIWSRYWMGDVSCRSKCVAEAPARCGIARLDLREPHCDAESMPGFSAHPCQIVVFLVYVSEWRRDGSNYWEPPAAYKPMKRKQLSDWC